MKKYFNLVTVLVLAVFMLSANVQAQEKFAHVSMDELLRQMPERQEAEEELEEYTRYLEQQFTSMQNELETKYQEYLDNADEYSQLIRQSKERELNELQQRIQQFQETAQQDLMEKEEELLRPVVNKARNAVQTVAEENGYTYVFDSGGGSLLYSDPGDNIMPLVKEELGLE